MRVSMMPTNNPVIIALKKTEYRSLSMSLIFVRPKYPAALHHDPPGPRRRLIVLLLLSLMAVVLEDGPGSDHSDDLPFSLVLIVLHRNTVGVILTHHLGRQPRIVGSKADRKTGSSPVGRPKQFPHGYRAQGIRLKNIRCL